MRHELNALIALCGLDDVLDHEAAAAVAILSEELPENDRLALFFPLGVSLTHWWRIVGPNLADDATRDAVLEHVVCSTLSSLKLLHGSSVVHCDIKASNIIMLPPAVEDLASTNDWAAAPFDWRLQLHDFGGADFGNIFDPLPPQPWGGGPRRKRVVSVYPCSWNPKAVDDIESLVIMMLYLEKHPAAELWCTEGIQPTSAELEAMPMSDALWKLDAGRDKAPGRWYQDIREQVAKSTTYSDDGYPFARRAWLAHCASRVGEQGRVRET